MDETLRQAVREVLAGERFGVLAVAANGRLHTATILFAETPDWELVHAIRPVTLKAQLSAVAPTVAFQVDNRAVTATDRSRFTRVSFEGELRHVPRDDPDWQRYQGVYAAKLPFGGRVLASPEVELYVLTPWTVRVALGGAPAEDFPVLPPDAAGGSRRLHADHPMGA
jgi:hypothetical protein